MRLPHLLEECSLHGGSLAASIALVDGSPAQRASTSQMLLVCMLHLRWPRRVSRAEGTRNFAGGGRAADENLNLILNTCGLVGGGCGGRRLSRAW